MNAVVEVKTIRCAYHDQVILNELSFHVNAGEIACLLGPSGCGKTTVLRTIAGFEPVARGEIWLRGKRVSSAQQTLAPEKRRLAMVFQDYALFPHLTVADNVCFGLRKASTAHKRHKAEELLKIIGLPGYQRRYPHELSGGQQQRVALARALAAEPDLILMDEPFSNLDVELREQLSHEVRALLKERGISAVIVTHDQQEAFALADVIGVMDQGRILQWDSAFNLYHQPADRFVANFVGQGVLLNGTLLDPHRIRTEVGVIQGERAYDWPSGSSVDVLLRPDDIVADGDSGLQATIIHKAFKGAEIMYTLKLPSGNTVLSLFPSHIDHDIGDSVGIKVAAAHLIAFRRADAGSA